MRLRDLRPARFVRRDLDDPLGKSTALDALAETPVASSHVELRWSKETLSVSRGSLDATEGFLSSWSLCIVGAAVALPRLGGRWMLEGVRLGLR